MLGAGGAPSLWIWPAEVCSANLVGVPRSPFDPPFAGPEALRQALRWGEDLAGWELSGLLQDLDRQREHIESVIAGENPRVAAEWLQEMVDSCRRRFGELRDDGYLVAWWDEELVVSWIRARQRIRLPAAETVQLICEQLRLFDEESSVSEAWLDALTPTGLKLLASECLRRADAARTERIRARQMQTVDEIRQRLRRPPSRRDDRR